MGTLNVIFTVRSEGGTMCRTVVYVGKKKYVEIEKKGQNIEAYILREVPS